MFNLRYAILFAFSLTSVEISANTKTSGTLDVPSIESVKAIVSSAISNFTIDISNTPLKVAAVFANKAVTYNIEGKFPTENAQKINFRVWQKDTLITTENQAGYALLQINYIEEGVLDVASINKTTIDGLNGYEIVAYDKLETKPMLRFMTILYSEDKVIELRGFSNYKENESLGMFRKVCSTFKLNKK